MQLATTIPGLLLALSVGTTAQADLPDYYPGGMMSFSYQEVLGGASGSYLAHGTIDDLLHFPGGPTGACAALSVEAGGTAYLLVASGYQNPDGTIDAAFVYLSAPAPLGPGTFAIDPIGHTALFGFVDDAVSFELPEDITGTNWVEWANLIVAGHKFFATNGTVTLSAFDPAHIDGTFQVVAADIGGPSAVAVPDGVFTLQSVVSVDSESWGAIKSEYAR